MAAYRVTLDRSHEAVLGDIDLTSRRGALDPEPLQRLIPNELVALRRGKPVY
jgi:hypothetical protein